MIHTQVKSSQIRSCCHDAENNELEVTFHNGGTYRYSDVSPEQYATFMGSESVGKALQGIKASRKCKKC